MKSRYIPHAGEKLDEATIAKSQRDNDARVAETASSQIDQAEDESCECESGETERCWVGEFATLDRLVETGLEFTTKCCEELDISVYLRLRVTSHLEGMPLQSPCRYGPEGHSQTLQHAKRLSFPHCSYASLPSRGHDGR